jgi:hypothetical protein
VHTPSVTPARADACTSALIQPPKSSLPPGYSRMAASNDYTEHQICELHGFALTDASHGRINNSAPERELIWVGIYGEGRWLRPEEVLELAAAMEHMANAHIERVANNHLAQLGKGGAA